MEQENCEIPQEEVLTQPVETEQEKEKKKKREAIFEMALFLILGVLIGITLKTEAVKKITMGFNDYQIVKPVASYDISAIKKELESKAAEQQAQAQAQVQAQAQQQSEPTE